MCQARNFIDPTMLLATVFFLLYISTSIDCSIFVYKSEDGSSLQDYDCVFHVNTPYCRRPSQPITLQREKESHLCYHNGTNHSFRSLRSANVTVHTVLQKWRSTIDKVDQYAHYLRQSVDVKDGDKQLCECVNSQSFGKNCEHLLPLGNTFSDVVSAKFSSTWRKLRYAGDIVCYNTLVCDFGLLCLDWRDICDGVQQCMFGLDEENCDKLEFNECEDYEYRCMNGMCIPDEYFLDGEYDCMDMSDEKGPFDDTRCPYQSASMECDDRMCPPNLWSCSDGQCIKERTVSYSVYTGIAACGNRRDQFFRCEVEDLWTQDNGRCADILPNTSGNMSTYCSHLLRCATISWDRKSCPCPQHKDTCTKLYEERCHLGLTRYPDGGLLAPYAFQYYNVKHTFSYSSVYVLNGTIKCRGYLASFTCNVSKDFFDQPTTDRESFVCNLASKRANFSHGGYHQYCHNDSRTFNNRSYHWINVCNTSSHCISAYRINDGFPNCGRKEDEERSDELVSKSCLRIRQHRFRCSATQASCLPASALGDLPNQCKTTSHELSRDIQIGVLNAECRAPLDAGCPFLRQLVEASWNYTLYKYIGLQQTHMKKIPFRSYCDTFQDSASGQDENATLCQSSWICLPGQWQCYTGHCIDMDWVLDGKWDCADGSDEETMFAVDFNETHPNRKWLKDVSFVNKFRIGYGSQLSPMCGTAIAYGCSATKMLHSSNCRESCGRKSSTAGNPTDCALVGTTAITPLHFAFEHLSPSRVNLNAHRPIFLRSPYLRFGSHARSARTEQKVYAQILIIIKSH